MKSILFRKIRLINTFFYFYGIKSIPLLIKNKIKRKSTYKSFKLANKLKSLYLKMYYLSFDENKKIFRKVKYLNYNRDFFSRLKILLNSNKINIVYITRNMSYYDQVMRYRVYNPCQSLHYSNCYCGIFFYENELPLLIDFVNKISIVIFSRNALNSNISKFLDFLPKKIKKIYDIDDLFYDKKYVKKIMTIIDTKKWEIKSTINIIEKNYDLAIKCDYGLTTNCFLANDMCQTLNLKTFVYPNTLNENQLKYVSKLNKFKLTKRFYVGYFSGSSTHANDFKTIIRPLTKILNEFSNVYLILVGLEFPIELIKFKKRIVLFPYLNMFKYLKLINKVDLNLVPLTINRYTNCKSELKFFEAAIVKTPTIASSTYAYKSAINNMKNGFLANTSYDWYKYIKSIILNRDNKSLCLNAYNKAINDYYNINCLDRLTRIFDNILRIETINFKNVQTHSKFSIKLKHHCY